MLELRNFTGSAGAPDGDLALFVASSPEERAAVFAQRYRAYLHESVIFPNETGSLPDGYDAHPGSVLIGCRDGGGKVVGSVRFALHRARAGQEEAHSCPEFTVFRDILDPFLATRDPIASANRLAIDAGHPRRVGVAMLLMLGIARTLQAVGARWGIVTARGSHLRLYQRFLMTQIGEPRPMPNLRRAYALLLSDVERDLPEALARFPAGLVEAFDRSSPDWAEDLRARL